MQDVYTLNTWFSQGGLILLAMVAGVAIHAVLWMVLVRFFRNRQLISTLVSRTRAITRYGFIVLSCALILPLTKLNESSEEHIHRLLSAAFIILLGWTAIIVLDVATRRYKARFQLDVADNLRARRTVTQVNILHRAAMILIVVLTAAFALMLFDSVRQFGVSLFASAGIAGIALGLAARPVLSNLIAGVQLAFTQPIRLDDVLVIEGEWGRVEEINSSYVVMKIWDLRRLVIPLSYFFEKPFENWTRSSASIIGSVFFYTDYTAPIEELRLRAARIVRESALWDKDVNSFQVTNVSEHTVELRILMSARNSGDAWDLRCEVREKMLALLQSEFSYCLPKERVEIESIPVRDKMIHDLPGEHRA